MTGSYTENSVKRKSTFVTYFAKAGLVLLTIAVFMLGFLINQQIVMIASI